MDKQNLVEDIYLELVNYIHGANESPLSSKAYSSEDRILWLLEKSQGSMVPSEIAKELKVTNPRVTVVLNNMDKEGLITRTVDKDDRRKIIVKSTKKGKNQLEKGKKNALAWLSAAAEEAGEADCEAVLRFLKICEKNMK